MKKIAIIGAGEFQNPLILKAKELGYETHVFAWKSGDIGESTADFFYPVSIIEKETIYEICLEIGPVAVVSIGSDLATLTVNYVARKLGLTCNPENNDSYSTNKYIMRKALARNGVLMPKFICTDNEISDECLQSLDYPVIVKPTDRSGSRGVSKVGCWTDIRSAIKKAVEESFENKAIVEDIIEGEEYSCECISFNGVHNFLAFTKKYTTDSPHYIETGHIQPAGISQDIQKRILPEIFKALDALEIRYGASHTEFRLDRYGNMRIIEIGARMGGDCIGSDLVSISTGYDFVKMVIEVASGQKPVLHKEKDSKIAVIKFIFNRKDLEFLKNISRREDIKCVRAEIKQIKDAEVVDSSSRYGYFIFECEDSHVAKQILER